MTATTTLLIDARGLMTLEIESGDARHAGLVNYYALERLQCGADAWAVRLTRLDTRHMYRVALTQRGRWYCDCPDWRYRASKKTARERKPAACKHCVAVGNLYRVLDTLMAAEPAGEFADLDSFGMRAEPYRPHD